MLPLKAAVLLLSFVFFTASANQYDYIVIGAGSAGSIVAAKLAEEDNKVLLLEAGGDDSDPVVKNMFEYFSISSPSSYLNYNFSTIDQDNIGGTVGMYPSQKFALPRGKVLGGSHSINAAAYVKGHQDDFNKIAQTLGDSSWSWNAMQEHFSDLESTLEIVEYATAQVGASAYIASAQSKLNLTYNSNCGQGNQNGICTSLWTGENGGVRSTSFNAYARPLTAEGNLDVVTFHRVDKILFHPTIPSKVTGVQTFNLRSQRQVNFTATQEIIVSSGTYNTPKILLLSGIGSPSYLNSMGIPVKRNVPGVGQNLRDHYTTFVFWDLASLPPNNPFLFQSPVFNFFGPETSGQTKYQFEISGTFGSVVPLKAQSVGDVKLASTDPAASPLIDPNVASTPSDLQNLIDGLKYYLLPFFGDLISKGLLAQNPFGLSVSATDEQIKAWVLSTLASAHHAVGTAKVGNSTDSMAVVNKDFVVKGTSNLRVIDASVFPFVPSGNNNAPTMAAALLGASKILDRRRRTVEGGGLRG